MNSQPWFSVVCFLLLSILIANCKHNKIDLSDLLNEGLDHGFPSFTLYSVFPNGETWEGAVGFADLEKKQKIVPSSSLPTASITKPLVTVVVLRLIEDGKLALDQTLDSILGEVVSMVPDADEITIEHLLAHTSGILDYAKTSDYISQLVGPEFKSDRRWTNADYLDFVTGNESTHSPGSQYAYSNTNYILLGLIVEKVTGQSFETTLREMILTPLSMTNTYMKYKEEPRGTDIAKYLKLTPEIESMIDISKKFPEVGDGLLNVSAVNEFDWTSGGLVSTASDLGKFATALFGGNLLGPKYQSWMLDFAAELTEAPVGKELNKALFAIKYPWGTVVGKGGNGPGVHILMVQHRETGIIMIAHTNIFGLFDEHDFMLETVFAKIVRRYATLSGD